LSPNQLCFDGFEESLNGGIIKAITFAAHGYLEPMLEQDFLVVM